MASNATTIPEYIRAAPKAAQPHLRQIFALLQEIAPAADTTIKWGGPFFVEPRFLFSFSATKTHLNFAPMESGLAPFAEELKAHQTTKNFLQIPYDVPLPGDLIRRIAERRLADVAAREDDGFW